MAASGPAALPFSGLLVAVAAVACAACAGNPVRDDPAPGAAPARSPVSEAHAVDPHTDAKIDAPAKAKAGFDTMMSKAMAGYSKELQNAATRDEEIEQLIRHYMSVTRQIFRRFKRQHTAASGRSGSYDPMPAWRYQAQASWVLRDLSARSGVMRDHLQGIANAQGLNIANARARRDRRGRLAYFVDVMDCISKDALLRADHGQTYLRKASMLGPLLPDEQRADLMRQELTMMRTTVRCTAMATRRNPNPAP